VEIEKKVAMNIWVYKDLRDKINIQARKENRNKSNFIANVVEKYLNDKENE